MSFEVPSACTLPTAAQPLRIAEFTTLFRAALRRVDRPGPRHLRLTLSGDDSLEAATRDLAAWESACCSFFTFTITPIAADVILDIEVPAAQTGVLDGLATLAATAAPAAAR